MNISLQTFLAVIAGGAFGTGARFLLSEWMTVRLGESFPWGTFAVNVLGCFVIGLFGGLSGPEGSFPLPLLTRQVVMIGVLGGFTTFSSFSMQTLVLAAEGRWNHAAAYVVLSLFCCLAGTWLGLFGAGCFNLR